MLHGCPVRAVQCGSYLQDPCNFRPGKLSVPLSSLRRNEVGPTFEDDSRLFSFEFPRKNVAIVLFPHSPLSGLMEFLLADGYLMSSLLYLKTFKRLDPPIGPSEWHFQAEDAA